MSILLGRERERERERELIKNYFYFLSSYYSKLLYIAVYYSMLPKKFRYNTIDKACFLRL